ncbi:uncharacterized protein LOC134274587, partial [Saccostrea cucullata]|uniref:uncharacterized protein LOC134274587 n=1 Tax=Saccostrea cuccullata TaxID=36930 RepID=UPI002ED15D2B
NCLETDGETLYYVNCLGFSAGCPDKDYQSNTIYLYPACQSINTENKCFLAESSCPNISWSTVTSNTSFDIQITTPGPQYESSYAAEIAGGLTAAVFILAVVLTIAVVLWRRMKNKKNKEQKDIPAENEMLLLAETTQSQVNATEQIDHNSQEQIANKTDEQSDKNAQDQLGNRTQERTGNSTQKKIDNNTQIHGGKDGEIESTSPYKLPRGATDPDYEGTTQTLLFQNLLLHTGRPINKYITNMPSSTISIRNISELFTDMKEKRS